MGQLIKLQDYVSRYEQDIFLYPSRFVRLKKQQWDKTVTLWEEGSTLGAEMEQPPLEEWVEEEKEPFMQRIKGFLSRGKHGEEKEIKEVEGQDDEQELLSFSPNFAIHPHTLDDLKHHFLDQLFNFQMKWASTTLLEQSFVDKAYFFDNRLKYFLQRFPDTYLMLYNPIFLLKNAPVEVEHVVVTPTDIWCISFLEREETAVFIGSNERFWVKRNQKTEEKILNPLLALNRTEKIVKKILNLHEVELPIRKVVLTRNGYIDYPNAPYDTTFIEKRNYEKWFQHMRRNSSPLKHVQLKAAQALLLYCQTTSVRRIEWEQDSNQE